MNEEWRPVVGYEDCYSVSNIGRVRREPVRRLLKAWPVRGYPRVRLSRDGVIRPRTIHSLVAEAFIGPRAPSMEVNHIDGNKANNLVTNLEYVTRAGNTQHAYAIGLMVGMKGDANPNFGRQTRGFAGQTHSAEERARIGERHRGNKYAAGRKLSAQHIARLRAGHAAYYARKRAQS